MIYKKALKRLTDLCLAVLGLLVVSPLLLVVAVFLYKSNQGQPFFFQQRPGKKGKIFRIVKFKTMNDKKDKKGNLLSDAQRLTWIGNIVRKASIDELPQLINVIKGDMSLIGPRPLLIEYLPLYSEEQKRRHEVRPGITGWAQVNGRNTLTWQKKFEYDIWYVDNLSFKLDLKILFMTLKKVLVSEGINAEGQATVENFKGNENA